MRFLTVLVLANSYASVFRQNDVFNVALPPKVKKSAKVAKDKFQAVDTFATKLPGVSGDLARQTQSPSCDFTQIVGQIQKAVDALQQQSSDANFTTAGEIHGLDPGANVAFVKK